MKKWISIPIIVALVAGLVGVGFLYQQETYKLKDAQAEIVALEARMSPKLDLSLPVVFGLTMTVDGVVTPGIGDSTIATVHWDWGDGNSEDRWLPASHTYTAYGEYTITVTAYQSDDLTSTKAFIIDIPLVIPDSNLEAAIREAINKPEGSIYTSDLQPLTTLEAQERGISDLTGLEYCVNLQYLDLWGNNISDISALAGLANLGAL